jgi:hypothetical protein
MTKKSIEDASSTVQVQPKKRGDLDGDGKLGLGDIRAAGA